MERNNETIVLQLQNGEGNRNEQLDRLWRDNLPLIRKFVHEFTGLDRYAWSDKQDFEDLEQQAFFGILEAIERYDSKTGASFMTCAKWYIRKSIMRYYDRAGKALRLPAYMRTNIKIYFQEKRRQQEAGEKVTDESLKLALREYGIGKRSFASIQKAISTLEMKSLDSYLNENDKDSGTVLDMLKGKSDTEETGIDSVYDRELHDILIRAIGTLPEKQKNAIIERHYQGLSDELIAKHWNCTKQNIQTLRAKGYEKIRTGRYARELSSFLPERSALRAEKQFQEVFEELSEQERDLLV